MKDKKEVHGRKHKKRKKSKESYEKKITIKN